MAEALALPALLLLPAAAAVAVPLLRSPFAARRFAMATMLVVLVLALRLVVGFDAGAAVAPFEYRFGTVPGLGEARFAVDGLNVYLLLLTTLLFPVVLACAWHAPEARSRLYVTLMLVLQAGLLVTFLAQNLLVLFIAWEAVLIPMVLMILVFGGERRRRAATAFFLMTMAGSVLFLAAVILLGIEVRHQTGQWGFDFHVLGGLRLTGATQAFVFGAVTLACAIKCPLAPFHAWLPLTYGQAPSSATVLMAGVMSKMGAYGFVKIAMPLAPGVAPAMAPALITLAVASILYGAVLALRQQDFRQLVAYASLSHMGYIVLGLFSFRPTGLHGAMVQIVSHGLAVAGLFLMLGLLEQRRGAAYLQQRGLASVAPRFAVTLMLFVLASLALPLTSGFTAEFLVLLGTFTEGLTRWRAGAGVGVLVAAVLASAGVVLGATYMLRFARTLLFGEADPGAAVADLRGREAVALAPLLLLIAWIGTWPAPFMAKAEPAVARLARPATVAASPVPAARVAVAPPSGVRRAP